MTDWIIFKEQMKTKKTEIKNYMHCLPNKENFAIEMNIQSIRLDIYDDLIKIADDIIKETSCQKKKH